MTSLPASSESISCSQYSSSARAQSAVRASVPRDLGIPLACQLRQQFVANPVARESPAGVGRVLAPFDRATPANSSPPPPDPLRSAACTSPSAVTGRMPASPAVPAPAQEPEQHRLRLVRPRMSHGDPLHRPAANRLGEKRQPRAPRLLLQVPGSHSTTRFETSGRPSRSAISRTKIASARDSSPRS